MLTAWGCLEGTLHVIWLKLGIFSEVFHCFRLLIYKERGKAFSCIKFEHVVLWGSIKYSVLVATFAGKWGKKTSCEPAWIGRILRSCHLGASNFLFSLTVVLFVMSWEGVLGVIGVWEIHVHAHACSYTPTHLNHVFMIVSLLALVKNHRLLLSHYDTASFTACRISNMIA